MNNDYACNIDNFVCDEYSICREERQYALYLHNVLFKYRKCRYNNKKIENIFKACGLEKAIIEYVFYEPTFMRDFFMRNRQLQIYNESVFEERLLMSPNMNRFGKNNDRQLLINFDKSFNAGLLKFLIEKSDRNFNLNAVAQVEEVNYGLNDYCNEVDGQKNLDMILKSAKLEQGTIEIKKFAQSMMNAKPDLAVIYKNKKDKSDNRYLLFIECKFESGVSYSGGVKQTILQGYIAEFLCRWLKEDIKVSNLMKTRAGCESLLVRFNRKEIVNTDNNTIWLRDLIEANNEIFK